LTLLSKTPKRPQKLPCSSPTELSKKKKNIQLI
jgi:hypothetical protein